MAMKIREAQVRANFLNLLVARQEQRLVRREAIQASRLMQIMADLIENKGFRINKEAEGVSSAGARRFAAQLDQMFLPKKPT